MTDSLVLKRSWCTLALLPRMKVRRCLRWLSWTRGWVKCMLAKSNARKVACHQLPSLRRPPQVISPPLLPRKSPKKWRKERNRMSYFSLCIFFVSSTVIVTTRKRTVTTRTLGEHKTMQWRVELTFWSLRENWTMNAWESESGVAGESLFRLLQLLRKTDNHLCADCNHPLVVNPALLQNGNPTKKNLVRTSSSVSSVSINTESSTAIYASTRFRVWLCEKCAESHGIIVPRSKVSKEAFPSFLSDY